MELVAAGLEGAELAGAELAEVATAVAGWEEVMAVVVREAGAAAVGEMGVAEREAAGWVVALAVAVRVAADWVWVESVAAAKGVAMEGVGTGAVCGEADSVAAAKAVAVAVEAASMGVVRWAACLAAGAH